MNKTRTIRSSIMKSAIFTFALALLANYNLERQFTFGEYVAAEEAYFVAENTDPAGLVEAIKFTTPTDEKYDEQKTRSLGVDLIGDIESVWDTYTGAGTTIAIIDDGFDYKHPEFLRNDGTSAILSTSRYYFLSGNSIYYKSYATDPTCIAQDWESDGQGGYEWASHGTATSSTAAAPINNEGGVGIAPNANILALKVDLALSSIEAAINYAVSQNVDVINMSIGAYAESFTDGWGDKQTGYASTATYLDNACRSAYNAGIIVVAAAGNEATWHKSYPACNTNVIGVGALGDWDNKGNASELAEFTNYVSASQTGEINVDILAPGYVYTAHQQGTENSPKHTYDDTQGTSFSSPIIAGAAALWKQKYPSGTPSAFLNELQSTADDIGAYTNKMINVNNWYSSLKNVGPSNITNGRLNVAKLLDIDNPFVTTKQTQFNIAIGEEKQISLNTYNGIISYSSNNPSIASVTKSGLIKGIGAGNTSIIVTATKNGKSVQATISVNVSTTIEAQSIVFNPASITLNVGDTYNAEETLVTTPSDATRIFLFDSNNPSVATIDDETGLIRAIGPGTAQIEVIAIYGEGDGTLFVTVKNSIIQEGFINFGSDSGRLKVNSSNISATDNLNNTWLITTTGTTSFTQNKDNSQIGSADKPAAYIEFKMTLSTQVTFTAVSALFSGNNDSAAKVTISVGSTQIGSGNVPSSTSQTITNTSTASGNILTIALHNISKGIKVHSITYTCSHGDEEVTPPTLEDISVNNSKTYHPGETIVKNDIAVTRNYSDGTSDTTTDFTFISDGYQFTYDDANSGGANTLKQFSITYDDRTYYFFVNVTRVAYEPSTNATTTISSAQFNASDLSKNSNIPSNTSVTISGVDFTVTTNAYVFSQNGFFLSFGKAAGSINNKYAFTTDLTAISVTQKSGARQDGILSISRDGNNWILYSSSELAKGDYRYFKYAYTSSSSASGAAGYSNIQTISYTLSGNDSATSVTNYIMYEDTNNQCLTKLPLAIEKLNAMTSHDKEIFWTSNDYVIVTARERLLAWAKHEGKTLTYSNESFQINGANNYSLLVNSQKVTQLLTFGIFLFVVLGTVSGLYLIKRRKRY